MDLVSLVSEGQQILTAMAVGEIVYVTADATSQLIRHGKIDKEKLAYTAKIGWLYGLTGHGIVNLSEAMGERIYNCAAVKSAFGIPIGNVCSAFFFANNHLGEENGYSVKETINNYTQIIKDKNTSNNLYQRFKTNFVNKAPAKVYAKSVKLGLPYWFGLGLIAYSEGVPDQLKTPTMLAGTLIWALGISALSLVAKNQEELPEVMDLEI
jgi:hypothetical protein